MVTRSHKLGGSAAAALGYYEDDETADLTADYYDPKGGFKNVWGQGAETLGLEHGLTREQFTDLFNGHWNGESLVGTGYRKVVNPETGEETTIAARTPAIDTVFSTPKSVAEYMVTATPEVRDQISAAVYESAHQAFTHGMEAAAKVARVPAADGHRGSDRVTADWVAVPVVQYSARPTEATVERGAPPDPHVHVHVCAFTTVHKDGRWLTADEFGLKNRENAEHRDQIFMGELSRRLEALGIEIDYADFDRARAGRVSWEVAGSNPAARQFWSSNSARALALRQEFEDKYSRPMTDGELTDALRTSRSGKTDKDADNRGAWERWEVDAREQGIDLRESQPGPSQDRGARTTELARRLNSPHGLCRDDSVFTGDSIRPAIARCAVGLGMTVDECHAFEDTFTPSLVPVRAADDPRNAIYTTPTIVAAEQEIARNLEVRKSTAGPVTNGRAVDKAIHETEHKEDIRLDPEQRSLIEAMTSDAKVVFAEAEAGAGKTSAAAVTTSAIRDAHPEARVVVTARAGAIAERSGKRLGADLHGSVESVESKIRSRYGKLTANDIVIADESSTLDTFSAQRLLRSAGDAKIVFLGDPRQLGAIGASGWYNDATKDAAVHELHTVHRHTNPDDLHDWRLIRQGKTTEAVSNLAERGKISVADDPAHKLGDVTYDYKRQRDEGRSASDITMLVDTANRDLDVLNRFAQADRRQRGEISGSGFQVHDDEQDRTWTLHRHDQIILLESVQGRGGGNAISRWVERVRKVEPTTIRNGMTGRVTDVSSSGNCRVELEDGTKRMVKLDATAQRQPIGLSYAVHASKFQGAESSVILAVPGLGQTSNNSAYSMATRSRDETRFYLDRETHGDDPLSSFADTIAVPEVQRSASWHLRRDLLSPTKAAEARFHTARMQTEAVDLAEHLESTHGIDEARSVVNSDGYPALVGTVAQMRSNGLDFREMLNEAYAERPLTGVQDPAAVLSWRLDKTPERPAPEATEATESTNATDTTEHTYGRPRHMDRDESKRREPEGPEESRPYGRPRHVDRAQGEGMGIGL